MIKNIIGNVVAFIAGVAVIGLLLIPSLIFGAVFYIWLIDYNHRDVDAWFIVGCMVAGDTEQVCKSRIY